MVEYRPSCQRAEQGVRVDGLVPAGGTRGMVVGRLLLLPAAKKAGFKVVPTSSGICIREAVSPLWLSQTASIKGPSTSPTRGPRRRKTHLCSKALLSASVQRSDRSTTSPMMYAAGPSGATFYSKENEGFLDGSHWGLRRHACTQIIYPFHPKCLSH